MSGAVTAGVGQATGQATIPLNGPGSSTSILITVTAPSGSSKPYAITVNRAAPASDNNLSALAVTGQTLTPAFAANEQNYTVNVATGVTSVTVSATKSDPNATMSGDLTAGAGTASTSAVIPLNGPGTSKVVSITVAAPSGSSKTYTITVNRAAPASDNNLSALAVTGQTLAPVFDAGTLGYTVDVATGVTSVTVSATKSDPNATMSGDLTAGAGTASTSAVIPLNGPGASKVVSITVAAPSGSSKTYTITVNRAAAAPPSTDAGLSSLTVNAGTLSPAFVAPGVSGLPGYTVAVPNATTSITITAVKANPAATLLISPSATVNNLPVGDTVFTIQITAEAGNSLTYYITVTRAL
jgi:hypothetical protein